MMEKIVDGQVVQMTPAEEAEIRAQWEAEIAAQQEEEARQAAEGKK